MFGFSINGGLILAVLKRRFLFDSVIFSAVSASSRTSFFSCFKAVFFHSINSSFKDSLAVLFLISGGSFLFFKSDLWRFSFLQKAVYFDYAQYKFLFFLSGGLPLMASQTQTPLNTCIYQGWGAFSSFSHC